MGLVNAVGTEKVVFGSDFPHPEGLANPVSYAERLESLGLEEVKRIMGGNRALALKVPA